MQAVKCTAAAAAAADHSLDGRQLYRHIHKTGMGDSDSELVEPFEAIVSGAARAALDMRAGLIVVLTTTGQSAYLLARYRLGLPILVISQSEEVRDHETHAADRVCHAVVCNDMLVDKGYVQCFCHSCELSTQ